MLISGSGQGTFPQRQVEQFLFKEQRKEISHGSSSSPKGFPVSTPLTFLSPFVSTINPLFEGNLRGSVFAATKRGVPKIGQGLGQRPSLSEKLGQAGEGAADWVP